MPFINLKTNVNIDRENEIKLKQLLGEAIVLIPGKSESSLMIAMEEAKMWFRGNDEACAMVSVWGFGKANPEAYKDVTAKICSGIEDILHINANRIYVKYSETVNWGCDNHNF